ADSSCDDASIARIERKASRIVGCLLFALAGCAVLEAVLSVLHHHSAAVSGPGLLVAVLAAVTMPILADAKLRTAEVIQSAALRADAAESITCGYLAWVLLAGLLANAALHWWWLDSVAALVLVPFLLHEA